MKRIPFDIAALIARVTLGVIFLAHGLVHWQIGFTPLGRLFATTGMPLPQLAATYTMLAEIVGGFLLIVGLLVRLAALALLVVWIGAIVFVHATHGIFVTNNGWELVASFGASMLLFMALGGGRFGIDGIINTSYKRRGAAKEAEREMAAHAPVTTPPTAEAPTSQPTAEAPTAAMPRPEAPASEAPASEAPASEAPTPAQAGDTAPQADVPQQPSGPRSSMSEEDRRAEALAADKNRPENT
ncbi:DoxX family membrane protein [Nonomuraea sp. NPDC050536]|uniref:DoxX family protein n=1 Tax=Nonomuraea sp. NPDC050536 TaxID=3364366 RepID=UPI0037C5959F